MAKVIQIRGVPDEVHATLVEAAQKAGKSLTAFVSDELAKVARSVDPVRHNRRVIAELRAEIGTRQAGRVDTVRLIQQQRDERIQELLERVTRRRAE